jgi:hypothetical protein
VSVVGLPTAAQAAPLCTGLGTTVTCVYSTPGSDTFVVPSGVTSLAVTAVGGQCGDGGSYPPGGASGGVGGNGAQVSQNLSVSPSETLVVVTGGAGADGTAGGAAGIGGINGGLAGGNRGGGGGASEVDRGLTPLVVAGGGGGSSSGTTIGTASATGDGSVTITYSTSSALAITTSSPLTGGTVGHSYSTTLAATGGTSPYTWALIPGSTLPAGLSLSTRGVISGTPTANGTKSFTVEVTDNVGATADKTFSLTIGSHSHADLAILLSHHGVFRHDRKGTYEVQVTSGTFWQCHKHKHTSFCSRGAKIGAHGTTTITVKVKITANKGTLVKSKATVSPSDSSPADNSSIDFALVRKK